MTTANLIVLPEQIRFLSSQAWAGLLLGTNIDKPISALKARIPSKKRAQELLQVHSSSNSASAAQNLLEDCFKRFKEKEVLVISIEGLDEVLELYEASHPDWHVSRGLPAELATRNDIVVITQKNPLPNSKEHFQEHCVFGFTDAGYFYFSSRPI